jgi:uncharacterized protein YlxP (DUF503 family)
MLICELHLPVARSLKEKRRVVKSLVERLHARFRVSIAETDFHDLHQRAQLAVALVDRSPAGLERRVDEMRRLVDTYMEASVVRWDLELFEVEP